MSMKLDKRANVKTTMTSFGTKLRVISFIVVAACIIPITKPTARATPSNGPAVRMIW